MPNAEFFEAKKGKDTVHMAELEFYNKQKDWQLLVTAVDADWLMVVLLKLIIGKHEPMQYGELKKSYEASTLNNFDAFVQSKAFKQLRENGLLIL